MSDYHRRKAWQAGNKAFRDGLPRSACTRPQGTIYYDDWHDGYNDAEREGV